MAYERDEIESLAAKLATLELAAGERAALDAVLLAAAGDAETAGFALSGTDPTAQGYANLEVSYLRMRLLRALGGDPSAYIGETERNLD